MLRDETASIQSTFARAALGEVVEVAPNVDVRKLNAYQGLVQNVFIDTLERAFPITKDALTKLPCYLNTKDNLPTYRSAWDTLVGRFMLDYKHSSPQLWLMPKGLLQYCRNEEIDEIIDVPYLNDLLLFEWIEIELSMKEDSPLPLHRSSGNLAEDKLVANPDFQLLGLQYPVFRHPTSELLDKKGNYLVVCFRVQSDFSIRFMALSEFFARTLEIIANSPTEGDKALAIAFEQVETGASKAQALEIGRQFLNQSLKDGLLVGYL